MKILIILLSLLLATTAFAEVVNVKYEKTDDPNIIKEIRTIEAEILLDRLQNEITELESTINAIPKPIKYPIGVSSKVKEAIDAWNTDNVEMVNKVDLVIERDKRQAFLDMLKAL